MACVAVGGTSLNGGSGSILKVVLGVVVLGVLLNALNLLGVQANEQLIGPRRGRNSGSHSGYLE